MLESLVHEVAGVKVLSMHHDISTVTGEEVVIFSLAEVPRVGSNYSAQLQMPRRTGLAAPRPSARSGA
jgi:uncharacterized protein YbcI